MVVIEEALKGGHISFNAPIFKTIDQTVNEGRAQLIEYNQTTNDQKRREIWQTMTTRQLPATSEVNIPFQSDFVPHVFVGERVFVNSDCFFVALGGICLADDVLIGPRVTLISVNHVEEPSHRRDLQLSAVHIEKGAWLGAGVTVLPGVTVGENAIVGAGSVVTKDVPAGMVVAGVPAKIIRPIKKGEM